MTRDKDTEQRLKEKIIEFHTPIPILEQANILMTDWNLLTIGGYNCR